MNRISITFYEEIMDKLEERKQKKGLSSIAQCVRELVELGLKIEEAASNKNGEEDTINEELQAINELKKLLKNNMNWAMETRLLSRFLVENMPNSDKENNVEVLEKYKEKATAHVSGLLNEDIE